MQETYAYAKTLLDVATSGADGRTRALLVGGGIANFTDVAATFKGIIQASTAQQRPVLKTPYCLPLSICLLELHPQAAHQPSPTSRCHALCLRQDTLQAKENCHKEVDTRVQAMKEKAEAIKAANMRIFVRRGGPNYQAGLALMRQMGQDTGIPVEVFGPETSMTVICAKAIEYVKSK